MRCTAPLATTADAAALRPWAARLRAVFEAPAAADKAQLIDALLVAADCRPRLVSHGAGKPFHFHYAPVETGLAARVRALTAAGLGHVVDGGAGDRLRACDRPGCGVAFIDTSRNGRRHFCSVRCANQVNVANHRQRRRVRASRHRACTSWRRQAERRRRLRSAAAAGRRGAGGAASRLGRAEVAEEEPLGAVELEPRHRHMVAGIGVQALLR